MSINLANQSKRNKLLLEIASHVVVWLLIFCLPYIMRFNFSGRVNHDPGMHTGNFFYLDMITRLLWVVVFYANAFLLAPLFIYRKKYLLYSLLVVAMLILIVLLLSRMMDVFDVARPFVGQPFRGNPMPGNGPQPGGSRRPPGIGGSMLFNLAPYFLTVVAGMLYRLLRDSSRAEALQQQRVEENMKTELSFLRSQISPHFIFNILNNITALARLKSDELEPTVIKLSSLMRYMLYETNEDKVLLRTETEYLQSYIDLQQQRFGNKVAIRVQLNPDTDERIMIEPMLLIPFVENAFKHGTGMIADPQIIVELVVVDGVLLFAVLNKCTEEHEVRDSASGIGFSNVRRRLNLLYGKACALNVHREKEDDATWFHVSLTIKLLPE